MPTRVPATFLGNQKTFFESSKSYLRSGLSRNTPISI